MSGIILLISAVSTLLFSLVVLTKLGVPIIVAILLALSVVYILWRYERQEDNENRNWSDYLGSLMDIKDIVKYVNKLF